MKLSVLILFLLAGACGGGELAQGSGHGLSSEDDRAGTSEERDDPTAVTPAADGADFLQQCVHGGGSVGMIHVVFECDSITVYSCKDISNVVLELENGERQRFQGGLGQVNTFSGTGGGRVVGVWVKAGENKSGDGPGYGERFDAPEDDCEPPDEAGSGGVGGEGGSCGSNDPDEVCGGAGIGGSGGSGGSGGTGGDDNGGEPICTEESNDPRCNVD